MTGYGTTKEKSPDEPESAAIFLYHHVDTDTPSSTSISPRLFRTHLEYLKKNNFTVWPLGRIAKHLAEQKRFPKKVVGLSFDDAYVSVYTKALPLLREFDVPFTVFVSTGYIKDKPGVYMSWDQLRDLKRFGGEIGNHSQHHEHLWRRGKGETQKQWHKRVLADIRLAGERLHERLGVKPTVYAHPYGEYTPELNAVVAEAGLWGFGQQSGAAGYRSDLRAIPRYPMTNIYGKPSEFKTKVHSRPLPVLSTSPASGLLKKAKGPAQLTLKLADEGQYSTKRLHCFLSDGSKLQPQITPGSITTVKIQSKTPLGTGRHKFTCTVPHTQQSGVFYWYSFLWIQPSKGAM